MALVATLFRLDSKRSTRCALFKTKNRSLLRHRGFNIEYVTFTTWCRKTDVTKWSDSPQSRGSSCGSSRRHLLSIWNIACGHQMPTWKFERTVARNLGCLPRAILGWNDHRKRGICWHCALHQVRTTNKWLSVSALGKCPPIEGNLTLRCVGSLIMWPYTSGGRSRRVSAKARTTVCKN